MLFANAYNFSKISACVDDANWNNGAKQKKGGYNCKDYAKLWCENGKARPGQEYSLGKDFNYPEKHCCVCGKSIKGM